MKLYRELIRYGIVGVTTNGFGYLLFVLFTTVLGVSPILTISIFYPFFLLLGFYLNKKWSFGHKGYASRSVVRYLLAYLGCYVLNVAVLKFFNSYLGYSHLIVQAIAIFPFALLLFLIQKYWVFRIHVISIHAEQAL